MSYLLKITEGPMRGAEIALVEGLRVRVGSGADCDIVLADAALPAEAFALDVQSSAVSFICGDDVKTLVPFEVFEVGASAFAIGPAEGVWEPLKKANRGDGKTSGGTGSVPSAADTEVGPPAGEATSKSLQEKEEKKEIAPVDATGTSRPQDASASSRSSHRGLLACCCALVVLLLLIAAVWFFWPQIAERCPQAEAARIACIGWFCGEHDSCAQKSLAPTDHPPTLAELARQYNLVLTNVASSSNFPLSSSNSQLLKGNFARRTERMAVRALALASDPTVRLELTDDESLAAAATELLFVVTEDALTVASATNGVVELDGYSPSAASLERTIRALNDDVPGVRNVLTASVQIGGIPPPGRDEPRQVFAEVPQKVVAKPAAAAASRRPQKKNVKPSVYPIAGILTTPYKTVVLENGMRVVEGGTIGNVVLERIEADRLIMRSGKTTFEWKP